MPRDLAAKILDVEIDEAVRRHELRWRALELGMREDEIAALLRLDLDQAEHQLRSISVEP
ncbi:hypothetical protein [Inquilinus sp. OTU3971]|uniref:hypothetical protein n=1 Tax=Inquilinus sp. OTU3971 TaxID=3043855 RepID=UPI00313B5CED